MEAGESFFAGAEKGSPCGLHKVAGSQEQRSQEGLLQCGSTVYIMFANVALTTFSQHGPRLESVWEELLEE